VVDDDPLVRWCLVRFLETRCVEARSAGSQEVALALLQEWPVDLLIADTSQSGIEESALVKRCQSLRPRPQIVLLTAGSIQLRPTDPECLGIVGIIEKPLILDRLVPILADVVRLAGETPA
jgi:DNA-binding NtrC family response regulator